MVCFGFKLGFFALFFVLFAHFSKLSAVTYIFSHGSFDTGKQAETYMKEYEVMPGQKQVNKFYLMEGQVKSFNFPDANMLCRFLPYFWNTCLGQEKELAELKKAFDQVKETENEIVLVGLSRGASAIINLFTMLSLSDIKKIKALVLISPFAHAYDVFDRNIILKLFYFFLKLISCFKEDGLHPIDCVQKISSAIPVIFACSKVDKTVPCASTIRLHQKLVDSGHKDAYLVSLDSGSHAKFFKCEDAQRFRDIIHAFYKKYGMACNINFAFNGEKELETCKN